MSQSDDMEAINKYIMGSKANPAAVRVRDNWVAWYHLLGWWDRTQNSAIYDEARNRRLNFNTANADTPAKKEALRRVVETGQTTEESQGGTRVTDSSGKIATPPEPWIPDKYKWGALVIGVGLAGIFVYQLPKALVGRKAAPALPPPSGGGVRDTIRDFRNRLPTVAELRRKYA